MNLKHKTSKQKLDLGSDIHSPRVPERWNWPHIEAILAYKSTRVVKSGLTLTGLRLAGIKNKESSQACEAAKQLMKTNSKKLSYVEDLLP